MVSWFGNRVQQQQILQLQKQQQRIIQQVQLKTQQVQLQTQRAIMAELSALNAAIADNSAAVMDMGIAISALKEVIANTVNSGTSDQAAVDLATTKLAANTVKLRGLAPTIPEPAAPAVAVPPPVV